MIEITIGHYVVREPKTVSRCPSYYAADWEKLELKPGRYPLRLTFEGGYLIPMPYWLLARIDAVRLDGATYSGFGGVNFAENELPKGEKVQYGVQRQRYELRDLVEAGLVELLPGFEWAFDSLDHVQKTNVTWDDLRAMKQAS